MQSCFGCNDAFPQDTAVIPGWSEGPDPESRDSGFDASHRPGMTTLRDSRFVLRTPGNDDLSRFSDVQLHIAVRCFASPRNDAMVDPTQRPEEPCEEVRSWTRK